jgi:HupH hydrogenase expression protein, C-terminal conserved region.
MRDAAEDPAPEAPASPMAEALFREIAGHLATMLETGAQAAIDLRSLPLSPDDRAALHAMLGEGEVRATVESGGRTDVLETRYPGVWRLDHFAPDGAPRHAEILITPVPDLLRADPADMAAGAARLAARLGPDDPAREGDDG